jgi:hypothetical protein
MQEVGISVNNQLANVEARTLPIPRLTYHDTSWEEYIPSIGQRNMMHKKMVNGGAVKQWTCINFSGHQVSVKQRSKTYCTNQPTNTRIGHADASNPWMKESC